jgi:hypothetical protein
MKKFAICLLLAPFAALVFAQTTTLVEGMDNPAGPAISEGGMAIGTFDAENGFDLTYDYNGTALINASGGSPNGGNIVFFGDFGELFRFDINTNNCSSPTLSFELWINSSVTVSDAEFVVEYDILGPPAGFTAINWGQVTSAGWNTVSGLSLPVATSNIRLRFRLVGPPPSNPMFSLQTAIDGITLTGSGASCGLASLPVELLNFNAKTKGRAIALDWATASERDNSHFVVERSADGRAFAAIDEVRGAGTTTVLQQYKYMDEAPLQGLNYYRLKQVDFDGHFKYSPIRSVLAGHRGEIVMAPSPAIDRVTAVLEAAATEDGNWQVFDASGRLMQSGVWPVDAAQLEVDVAALPQGVYQFRVVAGRQIQVKTFNKQ